MIIGRLLLLICIIDLHWMPKIRIVHAFECQRPQILKLTTLIPNTLDDLQRDAKKFSDVIRRFSGVLLSGRTDLIPEERNDCEISSSILIFNAATSVCRAVPRTSYMTTRDPRLKMSLALN